MCFTEGAPVPGDAGAKPGAVGHAARGTVPVPPRHRAAAAHYRLPPVIPAGPMPPRGVLRARRGILQQEWVGEHLNLTFEFYNSAMK